MTTALRDFTVDLQQSHSDDDRARWDRFWLARFPDCVLVYADHDWRLQTLGVDALLRRPSGKELLVEHKARATRFDDCLIEVWSEYYGADDPRNKPGWTVDPEKETMWLAYASRPLGKCWLLPFQEFRVFAQAVAASTPVSQMKASRTQRGQALWTTLCTHVPWDEVYASLRLSPDDVCFDW